MTKRNYLLSTAQRFAVVQGSLGPTRNRHVISVFTETDESTAHHIS